MIKKLGFYEVLLFYLHFLLIFGHPSTRRGSNLVSKVNENCVGGSGKAAWNQCKNNNHTISGYYSGPNEDETPKSAGSDDIAGNIAVSTAQCSNALKDSSNPFYKRLKSASVLMQASHSGEDVPIYSRGPMSHMFTGVNEQAYIGQAMKFASCVGQFENWKNDNSKKKYVHHC